jgi:hypothetical protein
MIFHFEEGSGFSAFAMFNAIKLHFTTDSYDYIRYHGKSNVTADNFTNRKDKYSFYKLSRKYRLEDLKNFYVANLLEKDVNWIGDINNLEGEETYKKWQKRNQSLTYRFEQDIIELLSLTDSPNEMLMVDDGQYPLLLKKVLQNTVCVETMVILNDIMNFFPMWDKKISDTVVWPTLKRRYVKYTPFINYDKIRLTSILKDNLSRQDA